MPRPMPKPQRYAVVQHYVGRRRTLAEAAHAYVSFYEDHPGFAIDWERQTRDSIVRTVQHLVSPLDLQPQCLCEEDWLIAILWAFVSNEGVLPDYPYRYDERTDTVAPVMPP